MKYGMFETLFMLTSPRFLLLVIIVLIVVLILRTHDKKKAESNAVKRDVEELKEQVSKQSQPKGKHEK